MVLVFTFVVKVRNPITDLSIKYYNECVDDSSVSEKSIFHKLAFNYIPLHYNTIFVIKTKQIYEISQLMLHYKVFGFCIGDGLYVYLLISSRYNVRQINPLEHSKSEIISLSDSIISVPFLTKFYRYHQYNIVLEKNKNHNRHSIPPKSIILLPHNDELYTTQHINIAQVNDVVIEDCLFTNYTIVFEKHLDWAHLNH